MTKPVAMLSRRQRGMKRLFDFGVAFATLVVVSPLFLATAALVKVSSSGPALYRHHRVGRNGVMFDVLKYRTMYTSDSDAEWQVTVAGDPRITPVGKWLRNTKLDELPQLWNVLRGEMSLVGWRPHVAGYPDRLTGADARLIDERPGITGAATLFFRDEERLLGQQADPKRYYDEVIYPAKVRMDLAYFDSWSLWRDISCLLITALPFADRWLHIVPTEHLEPQATEVPALAVTFASDAFCELPPMKVRQVVAVPIRSNGHGAAANGQPAGGNGHRPQVAVPVHADSNGSAANGHKAGGNGHRPMVTVPVRSDREQGSDPGVLGAPVVIRPPTVVRAASKNGAGTPPVEAASPASRD
jgi:lipopolysaccharide/colanic/teichoic acid biosynthesis glycosyltransferase